MIMMKLILQCQNDPHHVTHPELQVEAGRSHYYYSGGRSRVVSLPEPATFWYAAAPLGVAVWKRRGNFTMFLAGY